MKAGTSSAIPSNAVGSIRPVIITDTREQTPLPFTGLPSARATMQSGDYSFVGAEELFAVERKSVADLVTCCMGENRARFFRELHRLRGFRFKRLLVVGTREDIEAGRYRSGINPKSVLSTLAVIEVRFDVPVVFAPTPEAAALQVESWVSWYAREMVVNAKALLRSPTSHQLSADGMVPGQATPK